MITTYEHIDGIIVVEDRNGITFGNSNLIVIATKRHIFLCYSKTQFTVVDGILYFLFPLLSRQTFLILCNVWLNVILMDKGNIFQ